MAGHQTFFVRTGGCDYKCVWCDTMYAVDPAQIKVNKKEMHPNEVVATLQRDAALTGCKTLTLSGGNPVMWELGEIIQKLQSVGWKIAVETQGTLWKDWVRQCDVVTVSPKPPSAQQKFDSAKLELFLRKASLGPEVCVKIVVFDRADYEWAMGIHTQFRNEQYYDSFYVQPGTDIEAGEYWTYRGAIIERTKEVIDWVTKDQRAEGVRVMPQVHSLLYGWERGK